MRRIAFVVLLFLLAACTAETAVELTIEPTAVSVPPTAAIVTKVVVESTAVPTTLPTPANEPTTLPPTKPAPTIAAEEETEVAVAYGRTPEGAYFKGAANAPVTLIDYSDFL